MVIRRIGCVAGWVALLAVAWSGGGAAAADAELRLPSFVTVGSGYVTVEADRVVVSVGIETKGDSAEAAARRNEAVSRAIQARLFRLDLPDVAFAERRMNIWEERRTGSPAGAPRYRATSGLDVTVAAGESAAGKVIDVAMELGASSVQGVAFRASGLEEATQEALSLAVKDAVARAHTISEATGMRITMIRRVTDKGEADVINPSDRIAPDVGEPPSMPYPLPVRGELLVRVQVTVEFEVALQ